MLIRRAKQNGPTWRGKKQTAAPAEGEPLRIGYLSMGNAKFKIIEMSVEL